MPVSIVGWAHGKFGKSLAADNEELMFEVVGPALAHAQVQPADIDGIFVGICNVGFTRQEFQASLVGMRHPALANVPATRFENACATGSAALFGAIDFIEAGRGKVALVVGAEKMTSVSNSEISELLTRGTYMKEEAEIPHGFPGVFARVASEYFMRYGDQSDAMAHIAAKNHRNALDNPYAHVQKDLGFEFCATVSSQNPYVAAPLRRTDCSPVSDGAVALVIASEDVANTLPRAISFRSRTQVNDFMALSRRDVIEFAGARSAWDAALKRSKIKLDDLDLVETHDCFTIAELIEYEAMGLVARGEGRRAILEGWTQKGGKLPVNPSGGLKARGHPIGATGISMHVMAAMQLMNEAGGMQVENSELAGVFNMGSAAVTNYVSILERTR
ncbi:thiolase domain-containing protein [Burkholderia sp. Bp9140]|nr:thiolase domain-containing protein [Burkholderia sp. Bp9140]